MSKILNLILNVCRTLPCFIVRFLEWADSCDVLQLVLHLAQRGGLGLSLCTTGWYSATVDRLFISLMNLILLLIDECMRIHVSICEAL